MHYIINAASLTDIDLEYERLKNQALQLLDAVNGNLSFYDPVALLVDLLPWIMTLLEDRSYDEEVCSMAVRCSSGG